MKLVRVIAACAVLFLATGAHAASSKKELCEKRCDEQCQLGHKPDGAGYWFCEAPKQKQNPRDARIAQQQEKLRNAAPKNWGFDNYKKCYAHIDIKFDFTHNHEDRTHPWADPLGELVRPDGARVTFTRNHIRELEAVISWLKKCQRCYYNWRVGDYCATLKESIKEDKEDLK